MLKLVMKTDFTDAPSVEMFRTSDGFAVRYGLDVNSGLSLDDARDEYNCCLSHALGCSFAFALAEENA